MSMLPCKLNLVCGEGKTKQKVGVEHDINKLVAKFKKTGQMPALRYDGINLSNEGSIIDLTTVGDYQACQNRIAYANEIFASLPSMIRRRFSNDVREYIAHMSDLSNPEKLKEAVALGLVEQAVKNEPVKEPVKTDVNKDQKRGDDNDNKTNNKSNN